MKVVAFAASNSSTSINKILASYAAQKISESNFETLDLNEYELPLYSPEREKEYGQPDKALGFLAKMKEADFIVLSLAEHNGLYSAAFKNLFDWCSRIDRNIFQSTKMLLMATSPGERGGITVLDFAKNHLARFGTEIVATFSLGNFYDHYDKDGETFKKTEKMQALDQLIATLETN